MKQIKRKGKVKGSILFTVVAVMMVMVVFLMSTLVLTSSANRRSYYSYYEKQAKYAAQAALDTITNTAYNDGDFYNWLSHNTEVGELLPITITINDSRIPFTNRVDTGTSTTSNVYCNAEYLGTMVIWDEETNRMYNQNRWKITATARVGRGRNATEHSVTNYLYQNPVERVAAGTANKAEYNWDWRGEENVTTNTNVIPGAPVGEEQTKSLVASGLHTLQWSAFATGGNMKAVGPFTYGMDQYPSPNGYMTYNSKENEARTWNDPNILRLADDVFINCNYRMYQSEAQIYFQHIGGGQDDFRRWPEGLTVMGNFNPPGNGNNPKIVINAVLPDEERVFDGKRSNNSNFVYIDGDFNLSTMNLKINDENAQSFTEGANSAVNLYCGTFKMANDARSQMTLNGSDMFLYNPEGESLIYGNSTYLNRFVANNVTKVNGSGNKIGGNIFCNNKRLLLQGQGTVNVGGDVIMTNPLGTLEMSNVKISGSVVCAGNVKIGNNVTVDGGIYANTKKTNEGWNIPALGDSPSVHIESLDITADADELPCLTDERHKDGVEETEWKTLESTYDKVYFNICEYARERYDQNVQITVDGNADSKKKTYLQALAQTTNATNYRDYDYSLFPYGSRLDEIHASYIRWDLAGMGTDVYLQESDAAGHTYVEATYGGVKYPQTASRDRNAHAFIKEREYGESIASAYISTDIGDSKWTNAKSSACPTDTRSVTLGGHDYQGSESAKTITAHVIESDCTINLDNLGNCHNVFINPQSKYIKVILTGGGQDANSYNIIVNNTVKYTATGSGFDYSNVNLSKQLYTSEDSAKIFGREECSIFFSGDLKTTTKLAVLTSGLAVRGMGDNINGGQFIGNTITIVGNPYYPGTSGFKDETNPVIKYACELVPNIRVFGQKNASYTFGNGSCFFNAEVLMPESSLTFTTCNTNPKFYYCEYPDSVPVSYGGFNNGEFSASSEATYVIGSMYIKDTGIKGDAKGMYCYIGDENHPEGGSTTETFDVYGTGAQKGNDSHGNDKKLNGENYFSDVYQGAS